MVGVAESSGTGRVPAAVQTQNKMVLDCDHVNFCNLTFYIVNCCSLSPEARAKFNKCVLRLCHVKNRVYKGYMFKQFSEYVFYRDEGCNVLDIND